jgi:hypothetical protein
VIYSMSRDSFRDIRFEFNYSRSQFCFFHWLSLANPVLPTEITICRFAYEWGSVPPPHTPSVAPPLEDWAFQFVHWTIGHFSLIVHWKIGHLKCAMDILVWPFDIYNYLSIISCPCIDVYTQTHNISSVCLLQHI